VEKLFIVHVNSGEGIDAREREKGGGQGRGKPDVAAVLTVALVVLLPNEAVVHWGAASPADGSSSSSSSSLCAFPLVLLPLFFLFSLSLLLLLLLSVFFHFLSFLFGFFFSSLLSIHLCFSLFSPLYLFLFFLSIFHLQNSLKVSCQSPRLPCFSPLL
jgi:hypothetical protein